MQPTCNQPTKQSGNNDKLKLAHSIPRQNRPPLVPNPPPMTNRTAHRHGHGPQRAPDVDDAPLLRRACQAVAQLECALVHEGGVALKGAALKGRLPRQTQGTPLLTPVERRGGWAVVGVVLGLAG